MKTNVHVQTRFFWRIGGFLNWVYPWIIHLWYLSCVETCSIFFDMCLYFVHQFPYLVPKKNIFYVVSPFFPKNVHVFCPWISIKKSISFRPVRPVRCWNPHGRAFIRIGVGAAPRRAGFDDGLLTNDLRKRTNRCLKEVVFRWCLGTMVNWNRFWVVYGGKTKKIWFLRFTIDLCLWTRYYVIYLYRDI